MCACGGNGDGTLFYPGTVARTAGTTPVPVGAVRLAHIRDGMEDYEHLRALVAAGEGAFAGSTSRTSGTDAFAFDNDPARLSAAREALGDGLHRSAHPQPRAPAGGTSWGGRSADTNATHGLHITDRRG